MRTSWCRRTANRSPSSSSPRRSTRPSPSGRSARSGGSRRRRAHSGSRLRRWLREARRRVLAGHRLDRWPHFVGERLTPPDDVAGRPPEPHERVLRLGHQHPAETREPSATSSSSSRSGVERDRALRPVESSTRSSSQWPRASRDPSSVPSTPLSNSTAGDEMVVDARVRYVFVRTPAETRRDLTGEVARQVDRVRADVTEHAGAGTAAGRSAMPCAVGLPRPAPAGSAGESGRARRPSAAREEARGRAARPARSGS